MTPCALACARRHGHLGHARPRPAGAPAGHGRVLPRNRSRPGDEPHGSDRAMCGGASTRIWEMRAGVVTELNPLRSKATQSVSRRCQQVCMMRRGVRGAGQGTIRWSLADDGSIVRCWCRLNSCIARSNAASVRYQRQIQVLKLDPHPDCHVKLVLAQAFTFPSSCVLQHHFDSLSRVFCSECHSTHLKSAGYSVD